MIKAVKAPEVAGRDVDGGGRGLGIGGIRREANSPAAKLLLRGGDFLLITPRDDDPGTCGDKRLRSGEAEAARPADDDVGLVFEGRL